MSIDEHLGWQDADAATGFRGGVPCVDCPEAWRAERLDEGTCNEVTLG